MLCLPKVLFTCVKRGLTLPNGTYVKLDEVMSDEFCLDVIETVAQQIQSGEIAPPSVKVIVGNNEDEKDSSKVNTSGKSIAGAANDSGKESHQVTTDHLWKEVMTSLQVAGGGAPQHITLSAADIEELQNDSANDLNQQVALFSCGHHFSQQQFEENVLPKLETSLKDISDIPSQTVQLIVSMYKAPGFVPLACPNCVLAELRKGEF